MPYCTDAAKSRVELTGRAENPGELTFQLQQCLFRYLEQRNPMTYSGLAECLGAIEGAKLDLIERVVKPYEQKKLLENGDVWPGYMTDGRYAHGGLVSHPEHTRERCTSVGETRRCALERGHDGPHAGNLVGCSASRASTPASVFRSHGGSQ